MQKILSGDKKGVELLRDPVANRELAFTQAERAQHGLRGLLPVAELTLQQQVARQLELFRKRKTALEKHSFLDDLHNKNETLYYRFLLDHFSESLPFVYTPTVGEACQNYSNLFAQQRPRGLFMSKPDREHFDEVCRNWSEDDVEIIVMTDGSRILGLGDLGVNGMGIPVGKLALYVAAAGFHPAKALPVTIDMGTNNEKNLADEGYVGVRERRPHDEEFYATMRDAITAISKRWPKALLQFEDFSNEHAFGLLEEYKDKTLCFNDDIQGTAATVLAGLLASLRIQRCAPPGATDVPVRLRDQRIVFLGAGSAGVGVADLIAEGMYLEAIAAGEDPAKTKTVDWYRKNNFWLIDSKGVVNASRGDKLQAHKIRYAREDADSAKLRTLADAVAEVKPTMLLGLAGVVGGSFTQAIVKRMDSDCADVWRRPIIMALSNPTSQAECTAEQVYNWTEGRAIFASGSPFAPVTLTTTTNIGKGVGGERKVIHTGQGNNMYIFPGVGFGAVRSGASRVTNSMFHAAARALADTVTVEDLQRGSVYPELWRIREITLKVAAATCEVADRGCLTKSRPPPNGWLDHLQQTMWWPTLTYPGATKPDNESKL
ncbi:unnamed protein product [Amoebophrya sp. A25]|nr:unnamed protein product [Amoebophrya sp. A25]|eukprot:GSA25T00004542001.1